MEKSPGPVPGRAELTFRWALLLTAAFVLAACGSALAEGNDLLPPEVEATFEADFTPKALPKMEQAPVSLRAAMGFKNSDGSHPPALKEFEIEEDRHLRLNLKDVPVCGRGTVESPPPQQRCRQALIGAGKAVVNIKFPEQEPVITRAKVFAFNAGMRDGARDIMLSAYITVPTPATIVFWVKVKKIGSGPYGLNLVGSVPKIAGGSGSVTYLGVRFRKGVFSAACPDRGLGTQFTATFVEGTRLGGGVARPCTPAS